MAAVVATINAVSDLRSWQKVRKIGQRRFFASEISDVLTRWLYRVRGGAAKASELLSMSKRSVVDFLTSLIILSQNKTASYPRQAENEWVFIAYHTRSAYNIWKKKKKVLEFVQTLRWVFIFTALAIEDILHGSKEGSPNALNDKCTRSKGQRALFYTVNLFPSLGIFSVAYKPPVICSTILYRLLHFQLECLPFALQSIMLHQSCFIPLLIAQP